MNEDVRSLGGVPIPVDRRKLNLIFWLLTGSLVFYLVFFNDAPVPLDRLGASLALLAAILLPTWLWVSNRSQGLPIFPFYCLFFFPTYAVPLCRGDSRFALYTEVEIANAVFTVVGFLLLATLIWWQCTNRSLAPAAKVRAVQPAGSRNVMILLLFGGMVFELLGALVGEVMGGGYQALRGYAQNGSRLAVFVLFYQMGRGELSKGLTILTCVMAGGSVIRQAASTILATSFPLIGLGLAGFFLGSGKVPWKTFSLIVGILVLLHSGKSEMRAKYMHQGHIFYGGKDIQVMQYPAFFVEWAQKGFIGLTRGTSTEGEEIQDAKERAALLPLLLQIQKMTPAQVPYLEGASYEKLPSMLIPRLITKDKAVSHISNMIMAVHYEILTVENIWYTSIAFDLLMEAYANYGYLGVAGLAVGMGLFLGFVTLSTTGVPLFSFRFLMAILVLSAVVGSNNTMGVYVTTAWQGFLALLTLSLLIMKTIPNPLYAKPVASPKMGDGPTSLQASRTREELRRVGSEGSEVGRSPSTQGLGGREAPVAGPTSLQALQTREEHADGLGIGDRGLGETAGGQGSVVSGPPTAISENPSTVQQKHERPQRFIYKKGEKRG